MTKEELITLLKEHKENVAKLRLRKKEKREWERILNARENKEIFLYKPDESLYHVYENSFNIDNIMNMIKNKRLK